MRWEGHDVGMFCGRENGPDGAMDADVVRLAGKMGNLHESEAHRRWEGR